MRQIEEAKKMDDSRAGLLMVAGVAVGVDGRVNKQKENRNFQGAGSPSLPGSDSHIDTTTGGVRVGHSQLLAMRLNSQMLW